MENNRLDQESYQDEALNIIEAVLFASGEPMPVDRLCKVLEADEKIIKDLCEKLSRRIEERGGALELVRMEDKYQLCTKAQYGGFIRAALDMRRSTPLSQAAMEVLAIIAYNEPVTKNLIESVRGVDCSGVVSSLLAKGLITEHGRLDIPGRPMLYKTSELFLRCFGISSIKDLPQLPGTGEDGQIEGQTLLIESEE